jgi:LmbE family N-acetylglucosaminyl deacetylase
MTPTRRKVRALLGAVRQRLRLHAERLTAPLLEPRERRQNAAWRAAVVDNGVDITAAVDASLLVVAPHPDDETIGCGVLMARRRRAGQSVSVVVVSDGGTSHHSTRLTSVEIGRLRRQESLAACSELGVTDVRFLGFDDERLRGPRQDLVDELMVLLRQIRPAEVAVPSAREWHPEHRIVHDAALDALDQVGFAGVVREYPVWFWSNGPMTTSPAASPWVRALQLVRAKRSARGLPPASLVSTAGLESLKRQAFAEYRTQVTNYTGEPQWQPFPDGWLDKYVEGWEVFFPREGPVR